jgi:hypothetical protein
MDEKIIAYLFKTGGELASTAIHMALAKGFNPVKAKEEEINHYPHSTLIQPSVTTLPLSLSTREEEVHRGVSTADTIQYQKDQLVKQISLMEMHLQQGCKIPVRGVPTACDCCMKHPDTIEALAEETLGMTGDPVYREIINWCQFLKPRTTPEASASGKYDKEYAGYALEGRRLKTRSGSAIIPKGVPLPIIDIKKPELNENKPDMNKIKLLAQRVKSGELSREDAVAQVKKMLSPDSAT